MSPQRGDTRTRGRGSGAHLRVPAFSPRLAIFGILAAFAAVARAASSAAATGAVAGGHAALRFRALVHVEDMDAEVVLDERDEAGDGVRHSLGDAKTRHAEARAASEDALADIEERLYGTLRGTGSVSGEEITSTDGVASAFRDLFAFVADAPSPARARAEATRAAKRRAARARDENEGGGGDEMDAPGLETLSMLARVADEAYASALRDARAPLVEYFGEAVVDVETPVRLEAADGGAGGVSVSFGFSLAGSASGGSASDDRPSSADLGAVASEKGARLLEALASVDRRDGADADAGRERVPVPIPKTETETETERVSSFPAKDEPEETSSRPRDIETASSSTSALRTAARALSRAVEAAAAAAAARNAVVVGESERAATPRRLSGDGDDFPGDDATSPLVASLEDLPADWRAVADALYLLASLVELGLAPRTSDAYPEPRIEAVGVEKDPREATSVFFRAAADGRWSDVHFVDADAAAPTEVPTHPALASPKAWAAAAVFAAAEMGSREARLAAGDRALRGRGPRFVFVPEDERVSFDERGPIERGASSRPPAVDIACERATRVYLLPAAERVADAAEAGGDVRVPPEPPRLRERERDAGYVDDADAEDDGDAQIEMERDMAARGVPEAERHLGYRALMGRGVPRDEGDALRRFGNAANLGDPLAMFNLGYMHMRGLGTPVNHTKARLSFEAAAALDVAAAHNGLGVLDYNGWATADGGPNAAAARARFEAGAAAGDPDASFNLGTLYQTGGGGLPVDHAEAYARYQAASDAGHWRAPLAVAKITLEGWDPNPNPNPNPETETKTETEPIEREPGFVPDAPGSSDARAPVSGRVEKNCREAARLLLAFLEERLVVFSDEHEDALAALEGGFVEARPAREAAEAPERVSDSAASPASEETEVGPDPWGALVRYARLAERGSDAGLANAAFLAKKAGVGRRETGGAARAGERALPPHLTRRAGRDAARLALTRLAAMGDVEARVDLGDVEWAAVVEGDDDEPDVGDASGMPGEVGTRAEETPPRSRPPAEPAPASAARAETAPPPPPKGTRRVSSSSSSSSASSSAAFEFATRTRLAEPSVSATLDPPRPPAPAAPPRGFARARRVAFHYSEASLLGLPEGSVSLAWCWSRGVGVPRRDLSEAQRALWKAHDESADEMESFAPLAAAAAVAAARAAAAAFSFAAGRGFESADLVKLVDLAFGAKESNAVLYPESVPGKTPPETPPGTTSGDGARNGPRAAKGAKDGFFLRVERCVLATLACGFAAIGYARFIALAGERRDARAAFLEGLSPATVAAVAGAVTAAAWTAGV